MRRVHALMRLIASTALWITLATLLVDAPSGLAMARDVGCQRQTISMVVAPDNAWVALVREGGCSGGGPVSTSTDTVQLARRGLTATIKLDSLPDEAVHENDILVVDDYGHPENRPLTQWLSPRKLQITIPNISGIGLQKSSYDDVDVIIKYEPDDPAAREKWQRDHR
jgi:hypothetical protein